MIDREKLFVQLSQHEGIRYRPYRDSESFWTIGIGHCFDHRIIGDFHEETVYINLGRPLTFDEVKKLFYSDLDICISQLPKAFPWFQTLDEIRQRVLIDMAFNMGIGHLQGFKHFLEALENKDYLKAAAEMVNSTWYVQTGRRAQRLTRWMRTGEDSW